LIDLGPVAFDSDSQSMSGRYAPWHFLNFLPDPHQHGSLRPICSRSSTRLVSTGDGTAPSPAAISAAPATAAGTPPAAAAASALGWSSAVPPWYWRPAVLLDDGPVGHGCAGTPAPPPPPFSPSISTSPRKM